MKFILFLFATVLSVIALAMTAIGASLIWFWKFLILSIIPTAPNDYEPELNTYSAYSVIVREYNRVAEGKYRDNLFDIIEGSSKIVLKGEYGVRSDGRKAYVIYAKDDHAFGKENVFRIDLGNNEFDWINKNCRNNIKGCRVEITAHYSYETKFTKSDLTTFMPYEHGISVRRIK